MTTQELQELNNEDFHQHMAEVYSAINTLDKSINWMQNTLINDTFTFSSAYMQRYAHKLEIKQAARKRLHNWAITQVRFRMIGNDRIAALHSLPLVEALKDYITFMGEELEETAKIAAGYGWQSKRIEQGEKLRAKLEELGNVR